MDFKFGEIMHTNKYIGEEVRLKGGSIVTLKGFGGAQGLLVAGYMWHCEKSSESNVVRNDSEMMI